MCTIKESAHSVSPMITISARKFMPTRLAIMQILAFSVFKFSEFSCLIFKSHFMRGIHKAIIFGITIFFPRSFNAFYKLHRLRHGSNGQNFTYNMLTRFHCFYCKRGMLRGIIAKTTTSISCLRKRS